MLTILENYFQTSDIKFSSVSGGDINQAYKVMVEGQTYFVKYNSVSFAKDMFEKEVTGLQWMRKAIPEHVPKPEKVLSGTKGSCLVMEYIDSSRSVSGNDALLGRKLAELHQYSQPRFGLDHDNYIGSLDQINQKADTFLSFYEHHRIGVQVKLAIDNGLLPTSFIRDVQVFFKSVASEIPVEQPALIHGDLWGGNHMFDVNGTPYLIDPAVCFSHREMDIAMSLLFGGYSSEFYKSYNNSYPLAENWRDRMDIYQLYYILVHLNLFGSSYRRSADRIISKYI